MFNVVWLIFFVLLNDFVKDGCMIDGFIWDWLLDGYRRGIYWVVVIFFGDLFKDRDFSDDNVVGLRLKVRFIKRKFNLRNIIVYVYMVRVCLYN